MIEFSILLSALSAKFTNLDVWVRSLRFNGRALKNKTTSLDSLRRNSSHREKVISSTRVACRDDPAGRLYGVRP